eukprot:12063189-Alexandrium_andersonii.AAC.1
MRKVAPSMWKSWQPEVLEGGSGSGVDLDWHACAFQAHGAAAQLVELGVQVVRAHGHVPAVHLLPVLNANNGLPFDFVDWGVGDDHSFHPFEDRD